MPILPPPQATKSWQGHIHAAWEWPQELFDGSTQTFECITRQDSTSALVFLEDGNILLTKQEQPSRPRFIDFPGGRVDENEDHLSACKRELQEETGYGAADEDWMLWNMRANRGSLRFEQSIFIVRNAAHLYSTHADPGEKIETIQVSWDDLISKCLAGDLRQISTMYAILCMHFDPESKKRLDTWLARS